MEMRRIIPLLLLAIHCISCLAGDPGEGMPAVERRDYAPAEQKLRSASERGDAAAQFNLGLMYQNGQAVSRDYIEAIKWYRLAVQQGYAPAQNNLGVMYYTGKGTLQDYAEAIRWYRLAAQQGFALAQFNLGVMYGKGQGVPRDLVHANSWFSLAGVYGYARAIKDRDLTASVMTPAQIAAARKMVRDCMADKFRGCD